MMRYAATIFLSAFLLFQVQPLIGKFILPWFGGAPAVWTTCMLFFQTVLLGGYAYAHFLSSRVKHRRQSVVHLSLLVASLWFLPILPDAETWKPTGGAISVARILALLTCTIGLPYFLLSSTGPLLQESFHRETGRPPYRLYALSNAGSLLALLTYPFVFEPQLRLWTQIVAWSSGYALFVVLCGVCAWGFARLSDEPPRRDAREEQAYQRAAKPGGGVIGLWLALSTCGSVMLFATTNQMTQEIPSVPFLWVAPLALYLLSFIICFERDGWYRRDVYWALLGLALSLSCYALWLGYNLNMDKQLAIYPASLFVCCMVCHGELARARPAARYATFFYLIVAVGGVAGGILIAIVAPLLLHRAWDYPIGLAATAVLAVIAPLAERGAARISPRRLLAGSLALVVMPLGTLIWLYEKTPVNANRRTIVETSRNFYGILTVSDQVDDANPRGAWRLLTHGSIDHGLQLLDPELSRQSTTYYIPRSGVGLAIDRHPRRAALDPAERGLRIGVVGLGAGTLAANCQPGDTICFYEINPEIIRIAQERFTYLRDTPAQVEIVLGDARIEMERQLAADQPQQFDVLAIDAFSSDSIPMHLLTVECVALYRKHLKPDGILCLHLSNLFLNLHQVVSGIAQELECPYVFIEVMYENTGVYFSLWSLLTTNESFLKDPVVAAAVAATRKIYDAPPVLWTDDYGSLWQVLKGFGK